MKLSIITINYNNREGLARTIESVEGQTFGDYEWVVIDGGSTDSSKELIEKHAARFSYWVSEPDEGIYHAMNKGIRQASGDWLLFLNSGDWLYEPDTLERAFAHPFSGDIVYGDMIVVTPDGQQFPYRYTQPITLSYFYRHTINHQSTFISRKLFSSGLYNEKYRLVSDWAKWIEWTIEGRQFERLDQYISCFDSGGISSRERELREKEKADVLATYIPDFLKPDMEKIVQNEQRWGFLTQRKTLTRWSGRFYRYCKRVDKILQKIESIRQ